MSSQTKLPSLAFCNWMISGCTLPAGSITVEKKASVGKTPLPLATAARAELTRKLTSSALTVLRPLSVR